MEDFSDVPQSGPSINRRGGVLLHPVRDGVIPLVREAHITRRDRGGNLFAEVTDPSTGFCAEVTSPLLNTGLPVSYPARTIVPEHNPKRDSGILPQRAGSVWFQGNGANRRVIRTTELGEAPLPGLRRGKRTSTAKGGRTVAMGTDTPRTARTPPIATDMLDAWIRMQAEAAGKKGTFKITAEMRKLARLEIRRQQDIARFCGETGE